MLSSVIIDSGKDHQWILKPLVEGWWDQDSFMFLHVTPWFAYQLQRGTCRYNTEMGGHHLNCAVELVSPGKRQPAYIIFLLTRCSGRGISSPHDILIKQVFVINRIMRKTQTNPQ